VTTLKGRCMCGDIRFELAEVPEFMGVCHCKHCQRQSGSAFSTMASVPRNSFSLQRGTPTVYRGTADSGFDTEIGFCGRCGSPVYTLLANQAEAIYLKTGTLDETDWFEPQFHVWCADKQRWVDLSNEQTHTSQTAGPTG
jgi:hypothetical protein